MSAPAPSSLYYLDPKYRDFVDEADRFMATKSEEWAALPIPVRVTLIDLIIEMLEEKP